MLRTSRRKFTKGSAPVINKSISATSWRLEPLESRQMLAAHILGNNTVYSTIQAAVNAAVPGSTITVDAGSYAEMVTVSKSLTIDGSQAGIDARSNLRSAGKETILTGTAGSTGVSSSFYVAASDVTIDGFTVQGNTSASNLGAGIVIAPNQHGTHIVNNIIQNNVTGLYLANNSSTDAALIQHNVFLNNNNPGNNSGRGIYSDGGVSGGNLTNVTIDGNDIIVNKIASGGPAYEGGIALESRTANSQSNITITNNMLDGTGKLLMYNISNVTIEYNVVTHQTDQWSGTLRFEGGCNNITVKYNTVYDNNGPGLTADSKGFGASNSGFVVENNNFYNNNVSYGNKYGLAVTQGTYNGTFDARNNYWGSASGPSGQGTGTGDMIWGNGAYLAGAGSGWSTVAGNEMSFTPFATAPIGTLETPYTGVAAAAGAPIQAENYDQGGKGIGYSTTATSNQGGQYRTGEKVGIEATTDTGGGYDVGWTIAGETLSYTTNLTAGGTYNLAFRIASGNASGGKFHLNIDGQNVTGSITTPNTGGWQTWQTITVSNVSITAGPHVLQLAMDANGSNGNVADFNWIQLLPVNVISAPAAPTNLVAVAAGATSVNLTWQESSTNQTSFVIQRSTDGVNFTQIGSGGATAVAYSDATAAAGKTYTYRVYATNSAGNSGYSNTQSVTTAAIASAPTGLTAAAVASTQVNLAWTDTAAGIETGFLVERSTDGTNFTQIGVTATGVAAYTDNTAAAGAAYTYRVRATSAGGNSAYSATASATTPASTSITTYLSDLNWTSATAGWNTVQKNLSIAGNVINLNGVTYAKGLGTHAVSQIVYNLAGNYNTFISDVGVDYEENGKGPGSVDFQVMGDGKTLFDSGILTNASATVSLNVNVAGVQTLTLIATNGIAGSIDYDHADWAGARLLSSPALPAAPTSLTATASSASQINLAWTNTAINATSVLVERSADGTNFTQIATLAAGATSFGDTGLTAGTAYIYRVRAANSVGNSTYSSTASATTLSANAMVTYLSDLTWTSATAGWGTVQADSSISGNAITLKGATYTKGLGTHAASTIVYGLGGQYGSFLSDVGIDDEELSKGVGSVDFQVIGDGKVLFDSGVLTNSSPVSTINVSVAGVQTLTLVATNGIANDIDYDHADWAGARLTSASLATAAGQNAGSGTIVSTAVIHSITTTNAPVDTTDGEAPALPTPTPVSAAASIWSNTAINAPGQATQADGTFIVSGGGAGITGTTDACDYIWQSLAGNGTIIAHVASVENTDPAAQAGVMIRETLAADAKEASIALTPSGAVNFTTRTASGGVAKLMENLAAPKAKPHGKGKAAIVPPAPQWLELTRKGKTITAYDSVDGVHWKKVGSAKITMNADAYIGLVVASNNPNAVNTASFDHVTVYTNDGKPSGGDTQSHGNQNKGDKNGGGPMGHGNKGGEKQHGDNQGD